ncbi:MAG: hypothetical protein JSW46_06120 [Gemmatimonadota bacterium]|nr:MAG: hypothetical protein JSW46_06120 [Gemmatimonadota bacterium]
MRTSAEANRFIFYVPLSAGLRLIVGWRGASGVTVLEIHRRAIPVPAALSYNDVSARLILILEGGRMRARHVITVTLQACILAAPMALHGQAADPQLIERIVGVR